VPACCAGVSRFKPSTIQQFELLTIPTLKNMPSFANINKIILRDTLGLLISYLSAYSAEPDERVEFSCHAPDIITEDAFLTLMSRRES